MVFWICLFIFIAGCVLIYLSGEWIVDGIMAIARFLGWTEFVLSFLIVAFAGTLPNFFVGITSAMNKVPQLSFGDIISGNLIDISLVVALTVLISKKVIPTQGKTIETSLMFTLCAAILPIALCLDGVISRVDGCILIALYLAYFIWLFSKKERFKKVCCSNGRRNDLGKSFEDFMRGVGKVIAGVVFLLIAAEAIVFSAEFCASILGLSIGVIGILIVGLGNSTPEIYFSYASAKRGETGLILGNLLGSIITPATLVLGIVAIICPIEIGQIAHFSIARFFLVLACLFFFVFSKNDGKISSKEAWFLLGLYLVFLLIEIVNI